MKTNSIFSATLALALCFAMVLVTCSPLLAQEVQIGDPHPDPKDQKWSGMTALRSSVGTSAASSHSGASPWPTPTPTDQQFVVDTGSGLDTQCQFRSQGSLKFTINVTRVVGSGDTGAVDGEGKLLHPQQMVDNGIIAPTAELTLPAFDVDFNTPTSEGQPERDRILFNGQPIGNLGSEAYLNGENNKWRMNKLTVPISQVKFARENGLSPIPGENQVEILIDQANIANNKELWCTSVDWAALKFKALYPVVMVHGNGKSGAFWDKLNFTKPFRDAGAPYYNDINLPTTFIAVNSGLLAALMPLPLLKFGVNHIHIVCHSKGGLDTRGFLKFLPTQDAEFAVVTMTTLSTPHHGSALADYLRDVDGADFQLSDSPERVLAAQYKRDYNEGRQNLTTEFVERFNAQNLPLPQSFVVHGEKTTVQYFSIGADVNTNNSFFLGRPTITADELHGTEEDAGTSNPIALAVGGTLVYRMLYDVASTHWKRIYTIDGPKRIVIETTNETGQLNDMLVTIKSSMIAPFAAQYTSPEIKRNHASIADEAMGLLVLTLIENAQPVK
ncbi:MAG TPA: hypothetical protein VHS05_17995 [Pyrinomonadaceae bacterium]|jgi:hypothetical protein|nr:hypothetical protein [Pyrinomonadaceae bacterium]